MIADIKDLNSEQLSCVLDAIEISEKIPRHGLTNYYREIPNLVAKIVLFWKNSNLPIKDFARRIHLNESSLINFSQGKYIDGKIWRELIFYLEKFKNITNNGENNILNKIESSNVVDYNDLRIDQKISICNNNYKILNVKKLTEDEIILEIEVTA